MPLSDPNPIRVGVVEDELESRHAYQEIFHREPGFTCAFAWRSVAQIRKSFRRHLCDVLLLDLCVPGHKEGFEILTYVRTITRSLPVIIITVENDQYLAKQALTQGAAGYITKPHGVIELIDSVRRTLNGEYALSPPILRGIVQDLIPSCRESRGPLSVLTDVERQTLSLAADGCSNQEIAGRLYISHSAVKKRFESIYRKLNIHSKTHAVALFTQAGHPPRRRPE